MAEIFLANEAKLIECSLCLSAFDKPKCLPCIHTFCLNCLKTYIQAQTSDTLKCPLCREDFKVPERGVEAFPNNIFVLGITPDKRKKFSEDNLKKTELKCDQCLEEPDKDEYPRAELYCPECEQNLCTSCIQDHKRRKASKSHHLVRLEERSKTLSRNCSKHTAQPLTLNCGPCDTAICIECLISEHNGHRSEKIEEASAKWKKILSLKHDEMDAIVAKLPELLQLGQAVHESILDEGAAQQKRITERCNKLRELINKYEHELLSESKEMTNTRASKIKAQMDEISSYKVLINNHAKHLKEMKEVDCHAVIVCSSKALLKMAEDLLKIGNDLLKDGVLMDNSKPSIFHTRDGYEVQKDDIGIWKEQSGDSKDFKMDMGALEIVMENFFDKDSEKGKNLLEALEEGFTYVIERLNYVDSPDLSKMEEWILNFRINRNMANDLKSLITLRLTVEENTFKTMFEVTQLTGELNHSLNSYSQDCHVVMKLWSGGIGFNPPTSIFETVISYPDL